MKMSIVRQQMLFAQRLHPRMHIVFVFIDDLYAVRLRDAIRRNGTDVIPHNTTLHLVHYESFDPSTAITQIDPDIVKENVLFWSKQ